MPSLNAGHSILLYSAISPANVRFPNAKLVLPVPRNAQFWEPPHNPTSQNARLPGLVCDDNARTPRPRLMSNVSPYVHNIALIATSPVSIVNNPCHYLAVRPAEHAMISKLRGTQ